MKIKTNLHLHINDDPKDFISYSFHEMIEEAVRLGFGAVAVTCHGFFAGKPEYEKYAAARNILLISGIELALNGPSQFIGRHVVVLNCGKDIEKIRTLDELEEYKKNHPEIFILAPHPYYWHLLGKISLFEYLKKYIHLFDAIELSWFYSKWLNGANRRADKIARKYKLPFIATSDTHFINHLNFGYAVIDAEEKTVAAVLKAIREKKFYNVTEPRKFWREMVSDYIIKKVIFADGLMKLRKLNND